MKLFCWTLINGIFATALYFGLEQKIEGAASVAQFMAWYAFGAAVICTLASPYVIKEMRKSALYMPASIDVAFDAGCILFLVWHAWWWTAFVYAIHTMLLAGLRRAASKVDASDP
jgi:hypothetical protein